VILEDDVEVGGTIEVDGAVVTGSNVDFDL
jgi:hypothetical protein